MIWLPRADQPLVFASPTSLSLGSCAAVDRVALQVALTDAGGGAGAWTRLAVRQVSRAAASRSRRPSVTVPGRLTLRAIVSPARAGGRLAAASSSCTRWHRRRRIPYWLRVTARELGPEPHTVLRRPGVYRGDTRRRGSASSRRTATRARPSALGTERTRLPGPEQVFRFIMRGRVTNARRTWSLSEGRASTSRRASSGRADEDRLAGVTGAAAAHQPVPARLLRDRARGRRLPSGSGRLRPRLRHRQPAASPARSRSASGSTTRRRPSARLLTRTVLAGSAAARSSCATRGSGVDSDLAAARKSTAASAAILYRREHGWQVAASAGSPADGTELVFSVADYQETKNTENAHEDAAEHAPARRYLRACASSERS